MDAVVLRKVFHVVLALTVAFLVPAFGLWAGVVLSGALLAIFFLARKYGVAARIYATAPKSYGDISFACAVLALSLLFVPNNVLAFTAGMFTLAFADPAAALVGRVGRIRYTFAGESRSVEGSLACGVVSALVLLSSDVSLFALVVGTLCAALAEAAATRGTDNIVLPLTIALVVAFIP